MVLHRISSLAFCAGLLTACSKDATQIIVAVDSNLMVPAQLSAVRAIVRWEGLDAPVDRRFELGADRLLNDRAALPFSFGIGPAGDTAGGVTVELIGLRPGEGTQVVRRAVTRFRPGETLRLPMFLDRACLGATCQEGQTCTEFNCRAEFIDPATLEVISPGHEFDHPIRGDAGSGEDAGPAGDAQPGDVADVGLGPDAEPGPDAAEDGGEPVLCGPGVPEGEPCGPGALRCCGGACVDTDESASSCGASCLDCGANAVCRGGRCDCVDPFEDCDPEPGCEANLETDASNCSQCQMPCADGTSCIGASCTSCSGDGDCPADALDCTRPPECNGGECDQPLESGWCLIAGLCYPDGARRPANPCEVCDSRSPTRWVIDVGGDCDDRQFCTAVDVCSPSGQCVGSGDPCGASTPGCVNTSCSESGGCSFQVMPGMCAIDNTCYSAGARSPDNDCLACIPPQNQLDWSVNLGATCDDGAFCTAMDRCNATAACVGTGSPCAPNRVCGTEFCVEDSDLCQFNPTPGWCLIQNSCVPSGAQDPGDLCRACQPQLTPFAYSIVPNGTACGIANICCNGSCVLSVGGICVGACSSCGVGEQCECDESGVNCTCCPVGQQCI